MTISTRVAVFISSLAFLLISPAHADSILSPITDTVNSGIINTKMLADHSLSNVHVDATVINGVAVFSGVVNSGAQLHELIRIGRSVSGIRGVDVSRVRIAGRAR
jgi:osmotically-inducible protein OsmY